MVFNIGNNNNTWATAGASSILNEVHKKKNDDRAILFFNEKISFYQT